VARVIPTRNEGTCGVIQVRTLGESEIRIGRKRITPNTEMVFAIALYLCLRAGERVTRDEVVQTFWETADEEKGRHSLRQMLYRLRQRGFVLDEETEELYLDPARLDCDLATVLHEDWPETATAADVELAGAATPLITRRIGEHFQEWYDGLMDRVSRQHRRAALRQIVRARREGRWADLERWAQHVLRSDPLNEEATMARAESAAMAGSKSMALEILDQYMEELGDRAPVIGLPATVLRRRIAERRPEWGTRGPREVPLVGREELMARLTGMVDAAGRGEGRAVVLWGAPGVGKTRLARETSEYAELSGFRCLSYRTAVGAAAQPLSVALALVTLLIDLPGAAGCHPATLALLSRASRNQTEVSPFDPPPLAASSQEHVAAAILDLLQAVASERRLLLSIDDLHNADAQSVHVLGVIFGRSSNCRALLLSTSRVNGLLSATPAIVPSAAFMEILVTPLSAQSSAALSVSLCEREGLYIDDSSHHSIVRAAGGNPLFVRELTFHTATSASKDALPRSLRGVMTERLTRAGPEQTYVLRVISLLGGLSKISRIKDITRLPSSVLASSLEALEQEGILRLSDSRVLELHDCWQTAVVERTSPVVRLALSHDCANALREENGPLDDSDAIWRAAELYADAGDVAASVTLYCQVGDQMLARGFVAEAADIFDRAVGVCGVASAPQNVRVRHARALSAAGRLAEVLRVCDEARTASPSLPLSADESAALWCLEVDARCKLRLDHQEALRRVAAAAADARVGHEARQLACFAGIVVTANDIDGTDLQNHFFTESTRLVADEKPSIISALVAMIHYAEIGDADGVRRTELSLSQLDGEPIGDSLRCRTLRIRAMAHRWTGDRSLRDEIGLRAYEFAIARGLRGDAATAAECMTFAALDDADTDATHTWMARWEGCLPPAIYFERSHALLHAKSRLLIDQGAFAEALATIRAEPTFGEPDSLGKRRATDHAAAALCMAMLGLRQEGITAAEISMALASRCRPSPQIDFVVEYALRAMESLGERSRAHAERAQYIDRRSASSFPIAASFTLLRQASGTRL